MSEQDKPTAVDHGSHNPATAMWVMAALALSFLSVIMALDLAAGGQPEPTQTQQITVSVGLVHLLVTVGLALCCWAMALSKFSMWERSIVLAFIALLALIVVAGSLGWSQLNSMSEAERELYACTRMPELCDWSGGE